MQLKKINLLMKVLMKVSLKTNTNPLTFILFTMKATSTGNFYLEGSYCEFSAY